MARKATPPPQGSIGRGNRAPTAGGASRLRYEDGQSTPGLTSFMARVEHLFPPVGARLHRARLIPEGRAEGTF
jgi:hypothetical protein